MTAKGFSLLELLIVVTVLGIIVSITVPSYVKSKEAAGDATAKSDLRQAMTSIDLCFVRNSVYPPTVTVLESCGFSLSPGVIFTEYKVETKDGAETVHMHVQHADSSNGWHANYPAEGTQVDIRKPKP